MYNFDFKFIISHNENSFLGEVEEAIQEIKAKSGIVVDVQNTTSVSKGEYSIFKIFMSTIKFIPKEEQ